MDSRVAVRRCDACSCPLEEGESICPSCGHWQRVEFWEFAIEPAPAPKPACWALLHIKAPEAWAVGRSMVPGMARAAALAAGYLGTAQVLGRPDGLRGCGFPVQMHGQGLPVAVWDHAGGIQALALGRGYAGVGFSADGERATAVQRAVRARRQHIAAMGVPA